MNINSFAGIGIILVGLLTLSSCDPYQKLLKSTDYELKSDKAKEYYNKGEYQKSIPLLEELMTVYKGSKKVDKLYYHYAYSHYGDQSYLLSAHYFRTFVDYYPRSIYAEDALFMAAYSHYKMSPKHTLEQSGTTKAIEGFQLFANTYPNSTKITECNRLIDDMRQKLEQKDFEVAKLYYNLRRYQSAATSFKNILKDYPETPRREEILFLVLKSYFLYAKNSIATKQEERYTLAIDAYYVFIDKYPNSKYASESERIYISCSENLEKFSQK